MSLAHRGGGEGTGPDQPAVSGTATVPNRNRKPLFPNPGRKFDGLELHSLFGRLSLFVSFSTEFRTLKLAASTEFLFGVNVSITVTEAGLKIRPPESRPTLIPSPAGLFICMSASDYVTVAGCSKPSTGSFAFRGRSRRSEGV